MEAKMRIAEDMTYRDLDLLNPDDKDEMNREWSQNYLRIPESLGWLHPDMCHYRSRNTPSTALKN